MTKKKVLIVTDFFVPHWTGIVSSLTYLVDQYSFQYDFSVLTINHTNALPAHEKLKNATISRVHHQFGFSRAKISFNLIPQFIKMISQYETVIINSPNSNVFLLSLITRLFNKRLVIFHQGDLILTKGIINRFIEFLFNVQTHIGCMLAHTVATYTKDYAIHSHILSKYLYKLRSFLFIPKIVLQENHTISQLSALKKQGVTIFGFAGRYVDEKGVDILIKAINIITKTEKNLHFFFAGDETPYEKNNYFQKSGKLKKYITNLGLLNKKSIYNFLSSIDFLIIPSRSDCFPLVQVEALQQGVPIIVSNIPGARVPVNETGFGLIFTKEDATDLAQKIKESVVKRASLLSHKTSVKSFLNQRNYDKTIISTIG